MAEVLGTKRHLVVVSYPGTVPPALSAPEALSNMFALPATVSSGAVRVRPLFNLRPRPGRDRSSVAVAQRFAGVLSSYYQVEAPDEHLEDLAARLRKHNLVHSVFIKPPTFHALASALNTMIPSVNAPPSATPDFTPHQSYLGPAPGGVDAAYAWSVKGGDGAGVNVIDVEGEWRFTHEDLQQNKGGVVGGTPPNDQGWRNHGTAVLGVIGADRNDLGVTGIAPAAEIRAISIFGDNNSSSTAIQQAADLLSPGDILLLELHRPGPRYSFQDRDDQQGYIPIEWWPDDMAAIQYAVGKGIVVVEAGGNGAENLDDPVYDQNPVAPNGPFPQTWSNPFRRNPIDTGAIVVGAGAPPEGTHGNNWGSDRSRLDFSNYGQMVDAQGWGREVTTCAYGDLQGGVTEDTWYTDQFSGTSSASPVIVGTLACLQGALKAAGKPTLAPSGLRSLLRTTGSTQTDGPNGPATQRIGNRPDLRQMLNSLLPLSPPVSPRVVQEPTTGLEGFDRAAAEDRRPKHVSIVVNISV